MLTVSAKDTHHRLASYAMILVILCLYILDILTAAFDWSFQHWVFIDNGWNFWTVFLATDTITPVYIRASWVLSISGVISTLAADASMVRQL